MPDLSCLLSLPLVTFLLLVSNADAFLAQVERQRHRRGRSQLDPQQQHDDKKKSSSSSPRRSSGVRLYAGLYRPFANHAWSCLLERCGGHTLTPVDLDDDLSFRDAVGAPGTETRISIKAMEGSTQSQPSSSSSSSSSTSMIRYARYALLETLASEPSGPIQTGGIQVLNMVIFPSQSTNLPVWGADFVSLPGNKHLLLLDAQPMSIENDDDDDNNNNNNNNSAAATVWKEWYDKHQIDQKFPWGGDLPEKVKPYVSDYALWTRLGAGAGADDSSTTTSTSADDPIDVIQGPVMEAFQDHLDRYLDLVLWPESNTSPENRQEAYIQYRLENDPARPMLKRLYGEEWTEKVLHEVLFPQL